MTGKNPATPPTQPTDFERHRRPDGPIAPGEQRGKRTVEEQNDPEVEPGAGEGMPRNHPAQI